MAEIESRLAAVLAADVAGYSRLMQDDARATVESLDASRAVFRERIDKAGGRVVDTAGDSVLAVFELASKAVEASMAIQTALGERNAKVDEARRMRFRIGVHLGEVLHKTDGTIYGDGVNIAARLESLAEPGSVCVSSVVHDVVEGKLSADFVDAGLHDVKNIARPVRAFRIGGAAGGLERKRTEDEEQPSIAVLPFQNMSGDAEQKYFSNGITEDLITDLSKVSGLLVIARNSSFAYEGARPDVRDVASELGVRYVLEGSVRRAGNRVRITTQLIDGTAGSNLWAERYDRDLEDIFAVQDEVTRAIVDQLSLHLAPRKRALPPADVWELFLRAREHAWMLTPAAAQYATVILEDIIQRAPAFAQAHALLGLVKLAQYGNSWGDESEGRLDEAVAATTHALDLADADDGFVHLCHGTALQYQRRGEEALEHANLAVSLDPNFATAYALRCSVKLGMDRPAEGLVDLETSMRVDPHYPNVFYLIAAHCHYHMGNYERARALLEQRLAITTETDSTPFMLAACHGRLGEPEAAKKRWRQVFVVNPTFSVAERRERLIYGNAAYFDRIIEGIRMAGIDPDVAPTT